MAHSACKWILNNGVAAMAAATNERLDAFGEDVIDAMVDLDSAYLAAKHLLQSGDAETKVEVARFNAVVAERAGVVAQSRYSKLLEAAASTEI